MHFSTTEILVMIGNSKADRSTIKYLWNGIFYI
jgi:hypothetical protein